MKRNKKPFLSQPKKIDTARKEYKSPQLIRYGKLVDLTSSAGAGVADATSESKDS